MTDVFLFRLFTIIPLVPPNDGRGTFSAFVVPASCSSSGEWTVMVSSSCGRTEPLQHATAFGLPRGGWNRYEQIIFGVARSG